MIDTESPGFYDVLEEALADRIRQGGTIQLELTVMEAWALIGQVQLALRHPENNGDAAGIAEPVARRLQAAIATEGVLAEVLELSWNRQCQKCGCTNETPCMDAYGETCHWAGPSLCSRCAEPLIVAPGGT